MATVGRVSGCRIRRAPRDQRLYRNVYYDSKLEMLYAQHLDALVANRSIAFWFRQVRFALGCPENSYRVDFVVVAEDADRPPVYWAVEVKGVETKESRRWYRLWKQYGPCPLRVVKRCGSHFRTASIIPPGVDR